MKQSNLSGNAKMALMRSKVFLCAAVLGLVASFQISIMANPAYAIKLYSKNNGNIACSTCHSRTGLSNGTMYPLTSKGAYFKTNGTLLPRAAPVPTAPPYNPPAPPYNPPAPPYQPPYTPPQPPVYPPNVAPLPTVNLAYPLQNELKRLGCLPGRVDGVWGQGSRNALLRFSNLARLRLGSEPSQNALNVARRTPSGYCPPVRPVYPTQPPVYPTQPPVYPPNVAPLPTANLAYPLQSELKRLGCLPGRVDGVWGQGSRNALLRFSNLARLRLGSEPSQNALNVARRTPSGYCPPVRPVRPVYPTQTPIYPIPTPVYPPRVNNPPHNDPPPPTQASPQQCVKRCEVIGQQCHSKLTKLGNSKGWDGDLRKSYWDDNCAPKVNACKFSCNPKGPIGPGQCRYERDGSQICS